MIRRNPLEEKEESASSFTLSRQILKMKTNKCICGGKIKKDVTLFEGFAVDCFKCEQCSDLSFSSAQAKEIIRLREINKIIEAQRKIVRVGSSIAALLPKKLEDYGVREGLVDKISVLSPDSLAIKFKKDIF